MWCDPSASLLAIQTRCSDRSTNGTELGIRNQQNMSGDAFDWASQ